MGTKTTFKQYDLILNERLVGCSYIKNDYDITITPTQMNLVYYFFYKSMEQMNKKYSKDIKYIKSGQLRLEVLTTELRNFKTYIDIEEFQKIFGGNKQIIMTAIRELKNMDIVTNVLGHGKSVLVPAQSFRRQIVLDSHMGKDKWIQLDADILTELIWYVDGFVKINLNDLSQYSNTFQKAMYLIVENRRRMPFVNNITYTIDQWYAACNISADQPVYPSTITNLIYKHGVPNNIHLEGYTKYENEQLDTIVELTFRRLV
jgi:hypothetical protein